MLALSAWYSPRWRTVAIAIGVTVHVLLNTQLGTSSPGMGSLAVAVRRRTLYFALGRQPALKAASPMLLWLRYRSHLFSSKEISQPPLHPKVPAL